jgi:hypothetical protein
MTPAEKAKELYMKFYGIPLYIKTVKECCHITIDEIIHNNNEINGPGDGWMYIEESIDFWSEVKQEINKL